MANCAGVCKIHVAYVTDLSWIYVDGALGDYSHQQIREAVLRALGEYGWADPKCGDHCFCEADPKKKPKKTKDELTLAKVVVPLGGQNHTFTVSCKREISVYDGNCVDDPRLTWTGGVHPIAAG
jgi:hypothetical protein